MSLTAETRPENKPLIFSRIPVIFSSTLEKPILKAVLYHEYQRTPQALCEACPFCYNNGNMHVEINSRGNGACPICNSSGNCRIKDTLAESMGVFSQSDNLMELVIYSCPQFREKTEHE